MEIINDSQAEKHRIQALVKLVADLGTPTRQEIIDLLQPLVLLDRAGAKDVQSSAKTTLRVAEECGLLVEDPDHMLHLCVPPEQVEAMPAFQDYMRGIVLGVTEEGKTNYLLNLFSAWYAVQNERVFTDLLRTGYDGPFDQELFPDAKRQFNSTKFAGWRKWAIFLGLGWPARINGREVLIPDATKRVRAILPMLFPGTTSSLFCQFIAQLAQHCPELDGGFLFLRCWQASRGTEERGRCLSLMLSTALRTLDGLGVIRLLDHADALENWQLYPAQGSQHQRVTHIQLLERSIETCR